MNHRIIIRPFAELDLAEAWDYYRAQRPGLEEKFAAQVWTTIQRISENPQSYPLVHKQCRKAVVNVFPYNVIYLVRDEVVLVVAVYHASRKPSGWKNRL